jgi:hypothetical protein
MRLKHCIILLSLIALACGVLVTAQEPDDEVRGAFISTRPKTMNTGASTRRRRTRPTNSSSATAKNANTPAASASPLGNTSVAINVRTQALALGYTLFMRGATGRSIRVEPTREFHNGDSVRLALEPNVDGYLYVFHTEGEGAPEMIYPDPRLDGGENWIEAHVPVEVPSSEETDERLRWFTFYGNPGIERLYVVVTREPLPIVPTGNELVGYCAANKGKCPWRPTTEMWARIQNATKAEVKAVASKSFGQPQSEKEQIATTRGLGLDQSAPEPSVIRMNVATNAPLLVTVLDLIHK